MKKELIIKNWKVNLYAVLIAITSNVLLFYAFHRLLGNDGVVVGSRLLFKSLILFPIVMLVLHESLRVSIWTLFARIGFKSIGCSLKCLSTSWPCHCKEAIKAKHYRVALIMPIVILSILPLLFAFIAGNGIALWYGSLSAMFLSKDIVILFIIRKFSNDEYIIANSDKFGFYIENTLEDEVVA